MLEKFGVRFATFSLGISGLVCCAQRQSWPPDKASIEKLEASIQPKDFPRWGYSDHPYVISEYARYYSAVKKNGHSMVRGEFVLPFSKKEKQAGVYLVPSEKNFPMIFDGACAVVNILYDVDESKLIYLRCNGRA